MDGKRRLAAFAVTALLACGGCVNGSSPSLAQAPLRFSYSEAGDLEISRPEETPRVVALAASAPGGGPAWLAPSGATPVTGRADAALGPALAVRADLPVASASIDATASGIDTAVNTNALAALVPAALPVVAALPDLGVSASAAGVVVNAGLTDGAVAAGLGLDQTAPLALLSPTAGLAPAGAVATEIPVVAPVLAALLTPQTPALAPTPPPALVADVMNLPGVVAGLNSLLGRR